MKNKELELKRKHQAMQKAASRKEFIFQGGSDGRYKERVIPDKKKESKKQGK